LAAEPLDELEEDELLELEEELEEEDDDDEEDELDELTGGSSLSPPHAKRAVADISTPAIFRVRMTPDSDRVVNIVCTLLEL
jgi:hypothetical protein